MNMRCNAAEFTWVEGFVDNRIPKDIDNVNAGGYLIVGGGQRRFPAFSSWHSLSCVSSCRGNGVPVVAMHHQHTLQQ